MGACYSGVCLTTKDEVEPELQRDDSLIDSFVVPASPSPLASASASTGFSEPSQRYEILEGRLYEKTSNYILPIDSYEIRRMEMSHRIMEHVWSNDYFLPQVEEVLTEGGEMLDCGCGSGLYILETAARFPNSNFTGIDISPVFPTVKPKNVTFIEGDCRKTLPFADDTFAYVLQRALNVSYSRDEWLDIALGEIARVTRPGGWIEFIESSDRFQNIGNVTQRLLGAYRTFISSRGMDCDTILDLPALMKASGRFTDVSLVERTVPMGIEAGKTFHNALMENYRCVYHSLRVHLRTVLGVTDEHYDALVEVAVREFVTYNTRFIIRRVVARKKLQPALS